MKACACGCGDPVKTDGAKWLIGHHQRLSAIEYVIDPATGCWNWQKGTSHGYGRKWVARVGVPAHRWYYEDAHGPIAGGLVIDHLCKNRRCVNPAHLEPVTSAENIRRAGKLSATQVALIRASDEQPADIAKRFGISAFRCSEIRHGMTWRHRHGTWDDVTWPGLATDPRTLPIDIAIVRNAQEARETR